VVSARFETYNETMNERMTRRNLVWKELRKIPVVIVIGPGHRLYSKKELCPRDFDQEVLLETPGMNLSKCTFLKEHIRLDSTHAIVTNNSSLKNEMLAQGLGFTIQKMPSERSISRYGFRCIPIEGVFQRLLVATNPLRPLRPEAERFLQILEEEVDLYVDPISEEK